MVKVPEGGEPLFWVPTSVQYLADRHVGLAGYSKSDKVAPNMEKFPENLLFLLNRSYLR